MKKTLLSLFHLLTISIGVKAQWVPSGLNVVNNNSGYVGVTTDLIVTGTTTLGGAVVLNTTLGVNGAANFSNTVTSNSPFISSNGSGFQLNRPAGNTRDITWQSGGLSRWVLRADATGEGGSNTGSDFNVIGRDDAGTSLGTYLFIKRSSGNVGIGLTNPQNKLDVNGRIHSKSVMIDLNGWSDYVFKATYQLPSLTKVKAFIDQNQRLPEVPSEQEMIKNGLDVSEMNKLLMKKVEELTLYAIENERKDREREVAKDKMLASLQEQINLLKQQQRKLAKKKRY